MVRQLIIGVVLAVALSVAAGNVYAVAEGVLLFGTDVAPGLFCEVQKLDVCVMAQTEEDCTKLGGEKVDSCSMAENEKE